ncbi:MAG: mannose-6-phosphate isomerase [Paracoccaceae bacterium]
MKVVNLAEKLALFDMHWNPKVVADDNGDDIMAVTFQGEFTFHDRPDTGDFFPVMEREALLDVEEAIHVPRPGESFVVQKGVRHRPHAAQEAKVPLIEPGGARNTGDPAMAAKKGRI